MGLPGISTSGSFDESYFDHGEATGQSLYTGYLAGGYQPAIVRPRVDMIVRAAGVKRGAKVLDFGCACGYFVRCLREDYDMEAYGLDVSEAALEVVCPSIRDYIFNRNDRDTTDFADQEFDLVIAKDVLEHIPMDSLSSVIGELSRIGRQIFIMVPVSRRDGGRYIDPRHEKDTTHVIRLSKPTWLKLLGGQQRVLHSVEAAMKSHNLPGSNLAVSIVPAPAPAKTAQEPARPVSLSQVLA